MLSAKEIVEGRKKSSKTALSFSAKEYEPTCTIEETRQIQDSLSEISKIISQERIKKLGSLSQAIWHPELKLAEITHQVGSQWVKMGHRINQKLYVHPEEALYLLESGALEIYYNEMSMSVQRAYFVLLGTSTNVSTEKYRVYSYLNSMGYKVIRHSSQNPIINIDEPTEDENKSFKHTKRRRSISDTMQMSETSKKFKTERIESLVECTENYDIREILLKLEIIHSFLDQSKPDTNVDYDVYLPTKKKGDKKKLKTADCRIVVHKGCNPMPDLNKLANHHKKFRDNVPLVNAIVFPDHIAFYTINAFVTPNALDLP